MTVLRINLIILVLLSSSIVYAQFGLKAGMNRASEIKSFSQPNITAAYNSNNLQGYQIGLVYQLMPKKSGLGMEIGALISQKGSTFKIDSIDLDNVYKAIEK